MKKETGIVLYCYLPFSVAGNIFILKNSLNEFFYIKDHPFYKKNNMKIENEENTVGDLLEFLFNLSEQPLLPENIQKEDNLFKLPLKNNKMNLS